MTRVDHDTVTQDQVDAAWAQAIKFHYVGREELPTPKQVKICCMTQQAYTDSKQGLVVLVNWEVPGPGFSLKALWDKVGK